MFFSHWRGNLYI